MASELKEKIQVGLSDNLTTCPMCSKTLKFPKCLPCLHSLCMECLNAHIMTSKREECSFSCPICSDKVHVPEGTKPEDWAKSFKSSHLVNSVMDALELRRGERKCDPCQVNRKRSPAMMWCTSCREALCLACTNSHRGMRITRTHSLIEISKIRSQPIAAIIKDEKCPDHDDQFLQFYCKDHKKQCCPTCAIAVHRKCDHVVEMAKLGKEIRTNEKAEQIVKRLKDCLETQQAISGNRGNVQDTMKTKKEEMLKEIKDLKQKIKDLLDEMESAFMREFDNLHESTENDIQKTINEGHRISKALTNTISIMEAALTYGSDTQLFIAYEKIQDECLRYENLLNNTKKEESVSHFKFKIDERLKSVATNVRKFGHLSLETDDNLTGRFSDATVRETAVFGARTPFDDFRGVDIFPNGDIIIADRISKAVLLFHSNGEFVSHVNFQTRPWGVAVLGVRTACTTLPESQSIHIIKSSYRKLEDYKTISTDINCFAITNFCGEYLTIQHKEEKEEKGRVSIAQSDKQLTHKTAIDITANHENVQGITYDESTARIFVATDFDAIECYSVRGRFIFRNSYEGCGDFRGMCVDRENNVYVASHAGKGVLQLTHEGERIRMIPTSPLAPLDVAITPRGNKMVVVGRSDMVYVHTFW